MLLLSEDQFRLDFEHSPEHGFIQAMKSKPNHEFDVGQLRIYVHPIECHTGMRCVESQILKQNKNKYMWQCVTFHAPFRNI